MGQAVCGPLCVAPYQQISQDCTCCVDTYNAQKPLQCGYGYIACRVTNGPNVGTTVCAKQCGKNQQLSEDCTCCISTGTSAPPPISCKGAYPVQCLVTNGPKIGQAVCAKQCGKNQQLSEDCTCCISTGISAPPPPSSCDWNQALCFAITGANMGQAVCGPKCISPQFIHPDCSRCVGTCTSTQDPGSDYHNSPYPSDPPGKPPGNQGSGNTVITPLIHLF